MASRRVRSLLLAPLLLSGCNVVLQAFSVPSQVAAGSEMTIVISGGISGTTGYAGCVLQLPIGWPIQSVRNNQNWPVGRDEATLLGMYVAEPGHYLAAFAGTGMGGIGGARTISQITITLTVLVPVGAPGPHTLKVSLAGGAGPGSWQIQEPAGIAQFAAITTAPYARSSQVTPTPLVDFVVDGTGLPLDAISPSSVWSGVAFGDVDGDGRDDLAAVCAGGGGTDCWLSRPGATWIERNSGLPTSTTAARVAFAQLDGDGFLDLVDGNGNGHVLFGNGGTSWTTGPPLTLPATSFSSVAVGDVDGDGWTDIAMGAATSGRLVVLLNNGNRTFRDASAGLPVSATGDTGRKLILADLDGDGDLDMLWAHAATPNLWLGDGLGGWTQGVGIPGQLRSAAAGDIDGDGVPEIVAGVGSTGISVFKHGVGNSWALLPVTGLPTSNSASAIALLDVDRDGRLDIVAASTFGPIGVFEWRNTASGFFLIAASGLPTFPAGEVLDLAVGDFDGNTFPDLAIAMSGSGPPFATPTSLRTWQNRRTGISPFGTGCAGNAFAEPQLFALGLPQRGNAAFAMQVQTPATGSLALFWFGGSRTQAPPFALPLDVGPFGGPTCTLSASLDYTYFGLVDAGGNYTVALPVPSDPALAFQTAFSQGAVFAPSANAFGMVFTRALALRVE